MKTRHLLITIATIAGSIPSAAYRLETTGGGSIAPERSIERQEDCVTVTYDFLGAVSVADELYPESVRLDIPGFGHNTKLGEPAYPVRSDSYEIPDGCQAQLTIVAERWSRQDISLAPSRPLLEDSSDVAYSIENVPPLRKLSGMFPESPVVVSNIGIYRDRKILYVDVMPVRISADGETEVCEYISYKIDFLPTEIWKQKSENKITHEVDETYMSSLYTSTLSSIEDPALRAISLGQWKSAPKYLILSIPEYETYVSSFMDWKRCMGYNTQVIYSSEWTPESIKSAIKNVYDSSSSLQYVLLIGDAKNIPPVDHNKIGATHSHFSDFSYGCMDGDSDMEQDLVLGRLNVSNSSEASVVINKILDYEKNAPTDNTYYNNALHAAFFQDTQIPYNYEDRRFTRTSEDIRNGLGNEGFSIRRVYYAESGVTPTNWNEESWSYVVELVENGVLIDSKKVFI